MNQVAGAILLLVTLFALMGMAAVGAYVMDSRSSGNSQAKKRLKERERLIHKIEDEVTASLQVDQYDLTAHRVADLIRQSNRELAK